MKKIFILGLFLISVASYGQLDTLDIVKLLNAGNGRRQGSEAVKINTAIQTLNTTPQFPSYVIEEISGTVYARPARNSGYTAYADTNFTSVITSAMGQLTTGGLIQIRKGLYDHLDTINILYDKIIWQGEGKYTTILKAKAALDQNKYQPHQTGLIRVSGKHKCEFRDLGFDGNGANQTKVDDGTGEPTAILNGIFIDNYANDNIIDNCYFTEWPELGVWMHHGQRNILRNSVMIDCYWAGFQTCGGAKYDLIEDCYVRGGSIGYTVGGAWNTIKNVTVESANGTKGAVGILGGATIEGDRNFVLNEERYTHDNKIIGGRIFGKGMTFGIATMTTHNNTIEGVKIYNLQGVASTGLSSQNDSANTYINCEIDSVSSNGHGIVLQGSRNCVIKNNIFRVPLGYHGIRLTTNGWGGVGANDNLITGNLSVGSLSGFVIYTESTAITGNVIKDNIFKGTFVDIFPPSATTFTTGNYWFNNWGLVTNSILPDEMFKNNAITATNNGLTDGLLKSGTQNITVASANANYIICLPTTSTATIGQIITGQIGANGCEIRVIAAQATTVYINGVTTNVEAAIPANSSFEVRCIDATHWILKVWDANGVYSAPVPDAV